jgi:cell wall assembly regulator SMI1
MDVSKHWREIESWLTQVAPTVVSSLRPPASAAAVATTEAAVGFAFPTDFSESLLRHDGQADDATSGLFPYSTRLGPAPAWRLLSLKEIEHAWSMMKQLVDSGEFEGRMSKFSSGEQASWWKESWIPIADDGGGDFVSLDLSAEHGGPGRVIIFHHDSGKREVLAPNFGEWLAALAGKMEDEVFEFDPEEGLIEADAD